VQLVMKKFAIIDLDKGLFLSLLIVWFLVICWDGKKLRNNTK
jgi:hypothetical protein